MKLVILEIVTCYTSDLTMTAPNRAPGYKEGSPGQEKALTGTALLGRGSIKPDLNDPNGCFYNSGGPLVLFVGSLQQETYYWGSILGP